VNDLVVRQTATGSYAIGTFGYQNRRPVFIPRDGIRFSNRETADAELREEKRGPLYDIHTRQELTVKEWKSSHVFLAKFADQSVSIKTVDQVEYADGSKPVSPIQPSAVAQMLDHKGGVMV